MNEAVRNADGALTKEDFVPIVMTSLCALPRDAVKQLLEEIIESDASHARNRTAWILGCVKRYVQRLKTGEEFLTLAEEKAGVIGKIKPGGKKLGESGAGRMLPATAAAASSASSTGRRPASYAAAAPPANKFKRGRIGA